MAMTRSSDVALSVGHTTVYSPAASSYVKSFLEVEPPVTLVSPFFSATVAPVADATLI